MNDDDVKTTTKGMKLMEALKKALGDRCGLCRRTGVVHTLRVTSTGVVCTSCAICPHCGARVLFKPSPLPLLPTREEGDCGACGRIGYRIRKRSLITPGPR